MQLFMYSTFCPGNFDFFGLAYEAFYSKTQGVHESWFEIIISKKQSVKVQSDVHVNATTESDVM
jgi:hypothetical protein